MDRKEAFQKLTTRPNNLRFEELCKAAETFGFIFKGAKGSHCIYGREGIMEMMNFQDVKGKAKPYQVSQLVKVVEKYRLLEKD